jgi:hypothetical protein
VSILETKYKWRCGDVEAVQAIHYRGRKASLGLGTGIENLEKPVRNGNTVRDNVSGLACRIG